MAIITARPRIPEREQRSNFQNATLQGNDSVAFSVATHIDLPAHIKDEGDAQNFLIHLLGPIATEPDIHFEFEVGPADTQKGNQMNPEMCLTYSEVPRAELVTIVLNAYVRLGVEDFEYAPDYNSFGDLLEERAHEVLKKWKPVHLDLDLLLVNEVKLREYEPVQVEGDETIFRVQVEVNY